jgi:hypothetical protein
MTAPLKWLQLTMPTAQLLLMVILLTLQIQLNKKKSRRFP